LLRNVRTLTRGELRRTAQLVDGELVRLDRHGITGRTHEIGDVLDRSRITGRPRVAIAVTLRVGIVVGDALELSKFAPQLGPHDALFEFGHGVVRTLATIRRGTGIVQNAGVRSRRAGREQKQESQTEQVQPHVASSRVESVGRGFYAAGERPRVWVRRPEGS
jgi:hypothetical protein